MAKNLIELRRKKYFQLSSQIAQLNNAQLRSLFDNSESNEPSMGYRPLLWSVGRSSIMGRLYVRLLFSFRTQRTVKFYGCANSFI